MSLVITCPACGTRLTILPTTAADGKFTCPNCDAPVTVPTAESPPRPRASPVPPPTASAPEPSRDEPDEDESERPRRRRRDRDDADDDTPRRSRSRPRRSGLPVWAWVVGGVGLLTVCCCGGVVFIGWAGKKGGADIASGKEYHVGDTVECGDLSVTIERARVEGFLSETIGGGRIM